MFDHVTIRVSDRAASERFYLTVLQAVGIERTHSGAEFAEWDDFSIVEATPDKPVTRRLHIAFAAPSHEAVDAFHAAGVDAGYRDDGAPGPRPEYRDDYYGAFLLDPDGNSAEAVHHGGMREDGNIDHLWIRVADLEAAARFYDVVGPHAGLRRAASASGRQQFIGNGAGRGSFSLVAGDAPTEEVHMAFPTADDADVHAFHAAATGAGYRDNGAPGERPRYHPGYYGAFALDPDGNNVEVVNHHRR